MADPITTTVPTATATDVASDPISAAIEASIADLPGAGDDDDGADEGTSSTAGTTDGEPPAPAAPATQEPVTADAPPATEEPEMRGRISAKRHQAILTRQREKQAAEHKAALKAHEDRLQALAWAESPEGQVQFLLAKLEENPQAIAQALAEHPKYAHLLQLKSAQTEAPPASRSQATDEIGEMPKPNRQSEDGQYAFYDADGLASLLTWTATKAAHDAEARIRSEYDGLIQPIVKERAVSQKYQETVTRVKGQLEHARKAWPGFAEHEQAIRPLVTGPKPLSLLEGYMTVVVPALQAKAQTTRDALRQEILAELNQKAGASGERVESGPAASGAPSGSADPISDAIRKSIRSIKPAA